MTLRSGQLGNYEIIRHLGSEIYLARDGDMERVLAVLALDGAEDAQLYEDLARCAELQHPVIVPVVDLFAEQDQHVLVYERIAGVSLREIGPHVRGQKLPPTAVWHLGHELAAGLAEAHALGIVHGRLEAEHVVVSWQAQVALIGLGTNVVWEQHQPGPFAAPEVRAGGAVTARANTYSLAAMLWWLLTDRYPPKEGAVEPLRSIRQEIPSDLALIIDDALEADPEKRIDCRELAEVFEAAKDDGQEELHWHMEVIRAVGDLALDGPPSSELFPTSRRAVPTSEPASSDGAPTWIRGAPPEAPALPSTSEEESPTEETPAKDTPRPIRSRRGIGKRSTLRSPRAALTEEPSPSQVEEPAPESDALTKERRLDDMAIEHAAMQAAEPAPEVVVPEVVEPPSPSPPPVVPSVRPLHISNEQLAPPATSRRHLVILLASTVSAFVAGVLVSRSFDAPAAPVATQTAQPEPPPPKPAKRLPPVKAKASAAVPSLQHGFAHLVAESTVKGAGVYVFGEHAGPPNQPLPVKCDRLTFVRLGTVPLRHWYTPGRSIFVRCGEVTRITLEPVPDGR